MKLVPSRLRWLVQRLRRFSPKRVLHSARLAQRLTPRTPIPVIVVDMLWCVVRYNTGFENYAQWDYRILTGRERRTFMTEPTSVMLSKVLNSPAHRDIFEDKIRFNAYFSDVLGRDWLDLSTTDAAGFETFVRGHLRALAKAPGGQGGSGIVDLHADEIADFESLYLQLRADGLTLVEEFLPQHEEMARLYPGSVNTLRIVTFLQPSGEVRALARVLKIGAGSFVDNYGSGGMYTMLDENGVVAHPAYNSRLEVFENHPTTGTRITGFAVPFFPEVRTLLEDVARRIPEVPYVGWDIAISPSGPVVIEGNGITGVYQSRPSVTGVHQGLMPVYREAIGF